MAESDVSGEQFTKEELDDILGWLEELQAYRALDLDALCWIVAAFEGDETVPSAEGNELYDQLTKIRDGK